MKIITLATVAAFAIAMVAWSVLSTCSSGPPTKPSAVGSGADVRDPGHSLARADLERAQPGTIRRAEVDARPTHRPRVR